MRNDMLGDKELRYKILTGLEICEGKPFLERFVLLVGKAKLLEFGLKKILKSFLDLNLPEEKLEILAIVSRD
ncbi:hypothetical protein [Serratia marcescens]|uniref:hypothetical protein n=1 Tax=Serratia marcescens TaxID=615 RepID=UPI0006667F00|nr:hypothetical protein [Serratia marcescens]